MSLCIARGAERRVNSTNHLVPDAMSLIQVNAEGDGVPWLRGYFTSVTGTLTWASTSCATEPSNTPASPV